MIEMDEANSTAQINRALSHDSEFDDDLGVLDFPFMDNLTIDKATTNQKSSLPFSVIHDYPSRPKTHNRDIYIPGKEINVKVIDIERSITTHPLNPNLYTIEFTHGPFVWTIKKRYKHIQNLHNQLKIFRATLNIPFPTKSHRERRNSFKNSCITTIKKRHQGVLPRYEIFMIHDIY